MKDAIDNPETMDKVLKLLIEGKEDYIQDLHIINTILPGWEDSAIEALIRNMEKANPDAMKYLFGTNGSFVEKNGYTSNFQEQGGFSALFKSINAEKEAKEKERQLNLNLAESTIQANELNQKNAKANRNATMINILLGLINVLILLIQMFSK